MYLNVFANTRADGKIILSDMLLINNSQKDYNIMESVIFLFNNVIGI